MRIKDIIAAIEEIAPKAVQENWDNSGLLVGSPSAEIESAVITLDVTEAVVEDAIKNNDQMIIAHHPLIFSGLKSLTGKNDVERAIIKAIKHDVAIYAAHTNIDSVKNGVSWKMAQKLGLVDVQTLVPQKNLLYKLVTFVPEANADQLRDAIFKAGAGNIGNYDSCSYNIKGEGSFRAGDDANPFVGEKGKLHFEKEIRIETVFPKFMENQVVSAMLKAHPYEEVAYDVYQLENLHKEIGLGVVGDLEKEMTAIDFLMMVKETFRCEAIRHTDLNSVKVKKVAVVGGSGSSFLKNAIASGADVFITGDFKYHQFFEAENKIIIADIGHYESEQFTKELFYEIVTNKFSKFAVRLSEVKTNPIKYLF